MSYLHSRDNQQGALTYYYKNWNQRLMYKARVNVRVFNCERNVITSVFTIQQTITRVCRRTNNYFVALLCMSVSSFLLQGLRRFVIVLLGAGGIFIKFLSVQITLKSFADFVGLSLVSKIFFLFYFKKLSFVWSCQIIPLTDSFLKSLPGRNLECIQVCQNCKMIAYCVTMVSPSLTLIISFSHVKSCYILHLLLQMRNKGSTCRDVRVDGRPLEGLAISDRE